VTIIVAELCAAPTGGGARAGSLRRPPLVARSSPPPPALPVLARHRRLHRSAEARSYSAHQAGSGHARPSRRLETASSGRRRSERCGQSCGRRASSR